MAQIAIDAGFRYGSQLPETVYFPIYFADQDWKKPNREAYMRALNQHRPYMASVMDWERDEQLAEVISWAEEAAQYCETVMIIPKVHSGIAKLPRLVNGKSITLGYSVPTKFGGTNLFLSEFVGWPVHLLGGSPARQMELARYLNVVSADGNMAAKMARRCIVWGGLSPRRKNIWTALEKIIGKRWEGTNPNHEAFTQSCRNIIYAWNTMR